MSIITENLMSGKDFKIAINNAFNDVISKSVETEQTINSSLSVGGLTVANNFSVKNGDTMLFTVNYNDGIKTFGNYINFDNKNKIGVKNSNQCIHIIGENSSYDTYFKNGQIVINATTANSSVEGRIGFDDYMEEDSYILNGTGLSNNIISKDKTSWSKVSLYVKASSEPNNFGILHGYVDNGKYNNELPTIENRKHFNVWNDTNSIVRPDGGAIWIKYDKDNINFDESIGEKGYAGIAVDTSKNTNTMYLRIIDKGANRQVTSEYYSSLYLCSPKNGDTDISARDGLRYQFGGGINVEKTYRLLGEHNNVSNFKDGTLWFTYDKDSPNYNANIGIKGPHHMGNNAYGSGFNTMFFRAVNQVAPTAYDNIKSKPEEFSTLYLRPPVVKKKDAENGDFNYNTDENGNIMSRNNIANLITLQSGLNYLANQEKYSTDDEKNKLKTQEFRIHGDHNRIVYAYQSTGKDDFKLNYFKDCNVRFTPNIIFIHRGSATYHWANNRGTTSFAGSDYCFIDTGKQEIEFKFTTSSHMIIEFFA